MIITRVDLQPCVMRKEDPNWRFALGANPVTEGVVVTLTAQDGTLGFGYGSATPHMGATRETLMAALTRFVPLVAGRDSFNVEEILQALDMDLVGNNQAKAAIDCALHDLNARILGIPLHQLLGGKLRDSVPILRILAIKTPEEMAVQAQKLVDAGYRYLKIKVHGEVTEDVARVRAIRRQVGDGVHLTIDANQSYSVKDAIAALNRMAEFDIDLAEQPVAAADLKGLRLVTDSVAVTVEAPQERPDLVDAARAAFERWRGALASELEAAGIDTSRAGERGMLVLAAFEGALILSRAYRDLAPLDSVRRKLRERVDAELAREGDS